MEKEDIKSVAKFGEGTLLYLGTLATLTTNIVTDKPVLQGVFSLWHRVD